MPCRTVRGGFALTGRRRAQLLGWRILDEKETPVPLRVSETKLRLQGRVGLIRAVTSSSGSTGTTCLPTDRRFGSSDSNWSLQCAIITRQL